MKFPSPLSDFLLSLPSEAHPRSEFLPKVGERWRAVCTFLSIPNETMQKQLLSNVRKIEETLFSLMCMWYGDKGVTWGALLRAVRAAELNAQATACWIGGNLEEPQYVVG